ncbi:MAG: hypothetical protein WBA57_13060 [Elainellaceae cyanobacterium]
MNFSMKRPVSLLLAASAMGLSVAMTACGGATTDDAATDDEMEEVAPEEGAEGETAE